MLFPVAIFTIVATVAILMTLLLLAACLGGISSNLLKDMGGRFTRRYERKVARSLRPIGIQCGSRGIIKSDWTLGIVDLIVDHTITLLIMF